MLFLWFLVARVVGVLLVGVVVSISLVTRATVVTVISFIVGIVGVTLVGVIVLIGVVVLVSFGLSTKYTRVYTSHLMTAFVPP